MIKIKFNNESVKHEVTKLRFLDAEKHIVYVDYKVANESGFVAYLNDVKGNDFSDYKTVYKTDDNYIYYSNDGSVYVEPTTIIQATFDGTKPEKIEVSLSTLEAITLSGNFKKEVKGRDITIIGTTYLDDYNYEIIGNIVRYTLKSEEQKKQELIAKYKDELTELDKRTCQWVDGRLTDEEYAPYKARKAELQKLIEELENN